MAGIPEGAADNISANEPASAPSPGDISDNLGEITNRNLAAPTISPTAQQTFGNVLTYGLPGLGVGFLDTVGQSLGLLKDSSIPDALSHLTGANEGSFADFYARNRQPLRTGGEITGMFIPGLVGMKILKSVKYAREAGQLGAVLKNSTALDTIFGSAADLSAKEAAVAQAAITGTGEAGVWAGRTLATPAVLQAKRSYYAARALDAARTTVAFELGNRAGFNASDTFYPADFTIVDQLKWAGLAGVAGVGLDFAAARYAVRNLIQGAIKTGQNTALSPFTSTVAETIFRPQERGLGLTQYASLRADLKNTTAIANSPVLKSNLEQDQINIKSVIVKQLELMAYDPHPIIKRTSLSPDQLDLGFKALDQNPTTFLYAKKLATVPEDGAKDFYGNMQDILDKARRQYQVDYFAASSEPDPTKKLALIQKATDTLRPIEDAANEIHYVIEGNGGFTVYKNRADNFLDNNSFAAIKPSTYRTPTQVNGQNVSMKNMKLTVKADNTIVLHDNGRLEIPAGATPMDYSAAYAAGSKLISEWRPVENQQFILTPDLNWRTLEFTSALMKAHPEAQSQLLLGGGFNNLDEVDFHVLNQKFGEFQDLMKTTQRQPVTGIAARVAQKNIYSPAQVLQRLNLPEPLGFQQSPVIEMFGHAQLQGMTDLNDMFPLVKTSLTPTDFTQMDLMQAHLRETLGITDPKKVIPIQGNLLEQPDVRPLFVAAKSIPLMARNDAMIIGLVQAQRDVQLERLSQIDPATSPLVFNVINKVITTGPEGGDLSGAADSARAVQTLHDGMASGTGQAVYQDRINEQFPTLKSAQLVVQNVTHYIDGYVNDLASASLTPKLANIIAPKNKADLLDFNRIEQSYRHGWDIASIEPSPTGEGFVFKLKDDSPINQKLMTYHFPDTEIEEGAENYMPDMSVTALKSGHTPLTVSQNAADMASAISAMSLQSGRENNALRLALGKPPVSIRDFHLPTPALSRDGTWFVRNDTGNVVATYTGGLESTNRQRALAAATTLSSNSGAIHIAVPLSAVQRDHAIMDDAFFDVIDYSDQLVKSGKAISGGLARTEVDTTDTTIKAMVQSLKQQYLNVGIRANAAIFEPELNYARQAAQMASRDNLGSLNIFDRYIATMFGQTPTSGKGPVSQLYNGVEGGLDKALSWLNAHYVENMGGESNTILAKTARVLLRKQSSEEEFRQFQDKLPDWNPLEDTAKWAESTFHETPAWASRPIMATLSKVSSTLALRFMDVGMMINNFAGLLTNMHSVTFGMRQLPGEDFARWISRTGAWGTQLTTNGPVTFSPLKAVNTAIKAFWSGELTEPMAAAAREGYFKPEYASLSQILTAPARTKTGQAFDKFVTTMSYLADHSEIMSRKIAWGMGYKIGKDLHGFTDERNTYIFANNFVNEMIGNYTPSNKPAMFQGALGLPIGAFQTYMFNLYRRMYGYLERGDKASLIAQYAAEASLFGVKGVPGYRLWNTMFQSNDTESDTFTNRTQRAFSPLASDLILNGTLSNIPRIWGSNENFAFNTRGSLDFPTGVPNVFELTRTPPAQFVAQTALGIQKTLDNIFSGGNFSIQQQEEILATFTTNRAIRSIMEQAAGVKVDQRGNLIDQSTRDLMHVAASILGTQTQAATGARDAFNAQRTVEINQEDLRATLNDHTRALFRGGNWDITDLQAMVHDYVRSGGNPAYFGSWLRTTFTSAMTPEAQTKMQELARSGKLLEFENMLAALQQNQNPAK